MNDKEFQKEVVRNIINKPNVSVVNDIAEHIVSEKKNTAKLLHIVYVAVIFLLFSVFLCSCY